MLFLAIIHPRAVREAIYYHPVQRHVHDAEAMVNHPDFNRGEAFIATVEVQGRAEPRQQTQTVLLRITP
ncbi:hypothetical protein JCM14469_17100 [Desulfatiferula olefinivorans]